MPSILSLAAAIFAMLASTSGTTAGGQPDPDMANAAVVYAATSAGPKGLWNNVRFGLPRVPRPRAPIPGW